MIRLLCFVLAVLASPFKSKLRLEAENAVLRHQLIVLRRKVRGRAQPTNNDRWFLVRMYRWFPSILKIVAIVQPDTLVRWHRASFRRYWCWKSNSWGGRPRIEIELRALIRQMSTENQLWGAPRIHGELRQSDELPDKHLKNRVLAFPSAISIVVGSTTFSLKPCLLERSPTIRKRLRDLNAAVRCTLDGSDCSFGKIISSHFKSLVLEKIIGRGKG
jgi:hypothetical protein